MKCPDHLFALDAIRTVYPDARLVFVHRDPVKVLLSVAKLTEVLRRPFTRRLDPHEIGRQESARWLEGTRRMMAVGDDAGLPEPVHHVHHTALVADPVGTVAALYRHFGLRSRPRRPRQGVRQATAGPRLRSARLSLRGSRPRRRRGARQVPWLHAAVRDRTGERADDRPGSLRGSPTRTHAKPMRTLTT